jgi:bacterioferritin (cytochrome b1)
MVTGRRSRRELLRIAALGGGGGGGGGLLAGGGGGSKEPKIDAEADASVLNQALLAEYTAIAAYRAGRAHVSGRDRALLETLHGQEQQHAAALTRAIKELGGRPLRPQPSDSSLPRLRSAREVMRFALDVEQTETAALGDAVSNVTTPDLRGRLATMLSADAQHLALVRRAIGVPPIPDAFVPAVAEK